MQSDPLMSIVQSLELTGGVFLSAEFSAPWAITSHVTEEDCRPFMEVPRQLIAYHVITEGDAVVSTDSEDGYKEHYRAKAGDIVILPSNRLHILASDLNQPLMSGDDLLLPAGDDGLVRIVHGGDGPTTRILCGFMASRSGPNALLNGLPEMLIVSVESFQTRNWIENSVSMAAQELMAGAVASGAVTSRICELILTVALQNYVESNPRPAGWLGAMAHPRMSRALALIHGNLNSPPTVQDLAGLVGMSRSSFVDRFTEVMGFGPGRYILSQRMQSARLLLEDTELSIAEIAHRVGYDSPEAFSRAFKRETGRSPGYWREVQPYN